MRGGGAYDFDRPRLGAGARLALGVACLVYCAAAVAAFVVLTAWWHPNFCPAGTFFSGNGPHPLAFVLILWPLTAALSFSVLTHAFGWADPAPGELVSLPEDRDFKQKFAYSIAPRLTVLLVVATPVLTWLNAGSQLCLSAQGVMVRSTSLSPVHVHPWSDVTAITATCVQRSAKGGPFIFAQADFSLIGGDHARLSGGEYTAHKQHLAAHLTGVSNRFRRNIDSHCPADLRHVLAGAPSTAETR